MTARVFVGRGVGAEDMGGMMPVGWVFSAMVDKCGTVSFFGCAGCWRFLWEELCTWLFWTSVKI